MVAEGFTVKDRVVLKRPTSVAEVVGWISSETKGEDRGSETSLACSLWSTGSSCRLFDNPGMAFAIQQECWPANHIFFLPKPAAMRVHISYRSRFRIALSIPSTIGQMSSPISSFNPMTRDVQNGHSTADLIKQASIQGTAK